MATTHGSWVQSLFTAAELLVISALVVVEVETTGLFVEELTVDACLDITLDTTKGQDGKCLACSPKAVSPSTQL